MSNVKFTGEADFRQVERSYEELARRTAKVEAENAKLKQRVTEQGGAYDKTRTKAGGLMNSLKGFLPIASVVGGVTMAAQQLGAAMQFVQQETEKAKSSMMGMQDSSRVLNQVARDTKDFQQLQTRADDAAERYGVDRDVAANVLFSARSEGWEQDYESVIASNQVVDPIAARRESPVKSPGCSPAKPFRRWKLST
jgi:tetrahydromethanopterin S-methyltransferase subunit G